MAEFFVAPDNAFHGTVSGNIGKTRTEILRNGAALEPDYHRSKTLTYPLTVTDGYRRFRILVHFLLDDNDRVWDVHCMEPHFEFTTENGYLEATPTALY